MVYTEQNVIQFGKGDVKFGWEWMEPYLNRRP